MRHIVMETVLLGIPHHCCKASNTRVSKIQSLRSNRELLNIHPLKYIAELLKQTHTNWHSLEKLSSCVWELIRLGNSSSLGISTLSEEKRV